jgi:hypothetical protein
MTNWFAMRPRTIAGAAALAVASLLAPPPAAAQGEHGKPATPTALTDADRAEIQKLTSGYAEFIGTCKPEAYAGLFESPRGYFESLARGRVWGQESLVKLVKSEPACGPDATNLRARNTPPAVISITERGVVGRVDLGATGHYEDRYVKTKDGWRFRSRNFVPKKAEDVNWTAQDFDDIRALAGDIGNYEDVFVQNPTRGTVYRHGGMTIDPVSPTEATGIVHLKDDPGRYEDVYVKGPTGWRFKSRTYVPTDPAPTFQPRNSRPRQGGN